MGEGSAECFLLVLYWSNRRSWDPKAKVAELAKFAVLLKSLALLNTAGEMSFVFYFKLGKRLDLLKAYCYLDAELLSAMLCFIQILFQLIIHL